MRVFVITGAGISAESGIPTFRGKDGYWRNLDPTKLATPEAFSADPVLVWEWYEERRKRIRLAQPNPAHLAVVKLCAQTRDFLLVTQNVDDLHTRAEWQGYRLSKDKIVQIHGDIFVTRCSRCAYNYPEPSAETPGAISFEQPGDLPRCPECQALMRPGVVWFGEQLAAAEVERVERFLKRGPCDLALVIGTTAIFPYIIDWTIRARGKEGDLVEVNPVDTPLTPWATDLVREAAGQALPSIVNRYLAAGDPC